jgi:hypothetical protein
MTLFLLPKLDNSTLYIANLLSSDSLLLYGNTELKGMNLTGYIYSFLRIFPLCIVLYVYRKKDRVPYIDLDKRTLYVLSLLYIYFVLIRVFSMPFADRLSNYFVIIIHLVLLSAIYDILKRIRPKVFHFSLFLMISAGSFLFYFLPLTFSGEYAPMYKRYYPYYSIFSKKEDSDREYIIHKENRNY